MIIRSTLATIAQLVEQTFRKRQVKSSNLFGGSTHTLTSPALQIGGVIILVGLPFKNLVKLLRRYIENYIMRWKGFARHPFGKTIMGFRETRPTIEF